MTTTTNTDIRFEELAAAALDTMPGSDEEATALGALHQAMVDEQVDAVYYAGNVKFELLFDGDGYVLGKHVLTDDLS